MPRCEKAWKAQQWCHCRVPHHPYNLVRSQSLLSTPLRQLLKNFLFRVQRQNCPLSFSCIHVHMPFTLCDWLLLTMSIFYDKFSQCTWEQVYVILVIKLSIFIIMNIWIHAWIETTYSDNWSLDNQGWTVLKSTTCQTGHTHACTRLHTTHRA